MAKKIVTLYIRDTSISLLVMRGNQVKKWANLPLDPGLVSEGVVLDEAQLASRVKELFSIEKESVGQVIVGLSGANSLYRILTLPEVPEAILPEAVRNEARRAIPVSLDEVYLSYQRIPSETRGEIRIFLTAYPRNVTDTLVRTLQQAGLDPYIMDLAPLALCRIPDEPRAIIVNARLEHLTIMVIADRLPQLIRRLSLPSEAESLSEKLPTISEEFRRTVAFYNSSHMERTLDTTVPVFVSGELADASESWELVVGNSGYSVSPVPSPVEYPEGFSPNEFSVNIGLALKEILTEREGANFSLVNFNALPEIYQPKPFPIKQILIPIGVAVGIGLIAGMVFFVQNTASDTEVLRSEVLSIESRVTQVRADIPPLEEQVAQTETNIEPLAAKSLVFSSIRNTLEEGREIVDGDISHIVHLLPTKVNLNTVGHIGPSVTVSGIAPNEGEIFTYARDLRQSGRFSSVIISSIKWIPSEEEEEETKPEQFEFRFLLN